MKLGLPKETKESEARVAITPHLTKELSKQGHKVFFERGCGERVGFEDGQYIEAGGIPSSKEEVFSQDLLVKVKEPTLSEYPLLKRGGRLFCFLHLAQDKPLLDCLLEKKIEAIAFETVTDQRGKLPILHPMSEIAGALGLIMGASLLQGHKGGKGTLLSGLSGLQKGNVVILGCGSAGKKALELATGLSANVYALDINQDVLDDIEKTFPNQVKTALYSEETLKRLLSSADLLIGAALRPGKKAPILVTKEMVAMMEKGSVIVDIAIDQGGCVETSRITTHSHPTFIEQGIVHYCVTNMPGAFAKTATYALERALTPYLLTLASYGENGYAKEPGLKDGINTYQGKVTNKGVAETFSLPFYEWGSCHPRDIQNA